MSVFEDWMVACCVATSAAGCTFSMVARTWPALHVIALFYVKMRDAADGFGADVGVNLRFDLSGTAYLGQDVFPNRLAGHHLCVTRLRARNDNSHHHQQHNHGSQSEPQEAFTFHL